jgi:hypothetical protein
MTAARITSRIVVLFLILATVSCSGKDKDGKDKDGKGGTDGKTDRSGLKNKDLRDSFSGDRKAVVLDVQLLGMAYIKHCDDESKPPANLESLKKYYNTDQPAKLEKHLKDDIDIIWNVKGAAKPGGEKFIVVCERTADSDGNRVVVDGNMDLRQMKEADFQTALKASK